MGSPSEKPKAESSPEDEMGDTINVDSPVTNHYYPAPKGGALPAPVKTGMGTLAKILLGSAIGLGPIVGAAGAIIIPKVIDYFTQQPAPPTPAPGKDTNDVTEIGLE